MTSHITSSEELKSGWENAKPQDKYPTTTCEELNELSMRLGRPKIFKNRGPFEEDINKLEKALG